MDDVKFQAIDLMNMMFDFVIKGINSWYNFCVCFKEVEFVYFELEIDYVVDN